MICRYLCITATVSLALGACKDDQTFTDGGVEPDASGADARTDLPSVQFPTDLAIGLVNCGGSGTFTFDVENTGGGDLDYEIASTNSAVFAVSPSSGTLVADTTTTFTLTATMPSDSTPGTEVVGDLRITSDSLAVDQIVNLHAAPRGGVVTFTPVAANFGDVELGLTDTRTVTVENSGNAPVDVTIGNPSDAEFGVAFVDGRVLANGASRDATISYEPAEAGADTATAAVTITGPVCGAAPTSLSMSANGVPDGAVVVTGNLAFGTQTCGAAAGSTTLTMVNGGNVPATWTAELDDAEAPYSLSAEAGTIPVGGTVVLTVTREAIPLPATPGNVDAVLTVVTDGTVTVSRTIPVTQLLSGSVLGVGEADQAIDFGWAPSGTTLTKEGVAVLNTGNASATAVFARSATSADEFAVPQSGATIAPAGNAVFDVAYSPLDQGLAVTGEVVITASNQCSEPVTVELDGGEGPWMEAYDVNRLHACGAPVQFGDTQSHWFYNYGNQELTVSGCAEVTAGPIDPSFDTPVSVGPGSGSPVAYAYDFPAVSGPTATTVRCTTNEKFYPTHDFTFSVTMNGADLVVTQPDGVFDFDCADAPGFKRLSITNNGNAASGYIYADVNVPSPLYGMGSGFSIEPGATNDSMGVTLGEGTCAPGSGYFNLQTGSGNVCSVNNTDFTVNLTGTIPTATPRAHGAGATPVRQPTRR